MTYGNSFRFIQCPAAEGAGLTAILFLLFFLFCPQGRALASDAAAPTVIWQTGSFTIYAIQDRPGGMDVSLFSGPASPEERARYFTDGKADASITVFLVKSENRYALIDAGFGDAAPGDSALMPALASLGVAPEQIEAVLLTHMHTDHIGGLLRGGKRAFPNARIAVSKPELSYWLSGTDPENANARLVSRVMKAYGTDFSPPFSFKGVITPGLTPVDASGHTPGHTAYLFEVEGKKLLIIGDLVHAAALQFPLPDECAVYDIDKDAAAAARKRVLGRAADAGIEIAGMHIPFPGIGKVERKGDGFALVQQAAPAPDGE